MAFPRFKGSAAMLGMAALSAACATAPPPDHSDAGMSDASMARLVGRAVPAGSVLYHGQTPRYTETRGSHFGFLVFTSQPTSARKPFYLAVCEAFRRNLMPIDTLAQQPFSVVVTYWPVTKAPIKNKLSCRELVDEYDYGLAVRIAGDARALGSEGPLLIAVTDQLPYWTLPGPAVVEMSAVSVNKLDSVFAIWRDRVTVEWTWSEMLTSKEFSQDLASLLNRFGAKLASLLTPKEWITK
jgi:hypothetical protein